MFKNYFTAAFRNFWNNKIFSIITISGLCIGVSAALVIFLIANYEFGYDKYQPDGNRIYRVVMDMKFNDFEGHSAAVPAPLSNAVSREITGVEQTVPVMTFQGDGNATVRIEKENSTPIVYKKQTSIVFTGPQYFYLMPHTWLAGAPAASLKEAFKVVLSESRAKQYFPSMPAADIIGKTIKYNDDITLTVSGIVKDVDAHTSLTAAEFISYATISETHLQSDFMMNVWNDWMAYSQLYIKLSPGSNAVQVEKQLKSLFAKYNKDANKDAHNSMALKLQPLGDIHFNANYAGFNQRIVHTSTLYGLLAIAAFLLLLGCINFINLTTANAAQRAKEIGIRKTMGSSKRQLIVQFLGETFLITFIATIIAMAISPLLLNLFKDFIPQDVKFNPLQQPIILLFLLLLTVFVSFIAGLYPALILSGYKPAVVLKSQASAKGGETRHVWVRKALTISQFVIAQFFVIATMMVSKQISYSLTADMGFKKDAIINFNTPGTWKDSTAKTKTAVFMNKLRAIPGIAKTSQGFLSPATEGAAFGNISYVDGKKEVKENVQVRWGDENYLSVYGIKLVAGRNVTAADSIHECLINEDYAKKLGFINVEKALNQQLDWNEAKYTIVGIMHDFHQHSTHGLIDPIVFRYGTGDFMHIALQPGVSGWNKTIRSIESIYKSLYPNDDFSYTFFDETIAKFYTEEQNTLKLLSWSTGLTILISCLGLLGLVMFTINTRTKEIGIRKILGASVASIVSVLSTDFVKLVAIAFLIAAPLAWWASYEWLEDFAFRTSMSLWVFVLAGVIMLLLALITLSFQTIKAALANPVKNLRAE